MKAIKKWISLAAAALLLILFYFNPFWILEYRLQDTIYQRPSLRNPSIAVIGIDERALAEIGTFPWSRQVWADVINILNRYEDAKPAAIALDVVFDLPSWDRYADAALADAVYKGGNVILASLIDTGFDFESLTLDIIITNHIMSFPELRPHGPHGLVNSFHDRDGVMRNALLRMPFEGEMLYGFPLVTAMKFTGLGPYDLIEWAPDGYLYSYISFTGMPGDFFEFSVADIFEDWFDPSWFADTVVLIGPWAVGMQDSYYVSITHGQQMYGVEIHANVLQMILENNFKQRVYHNTAFAIVAALLIGAMLMGELFNIRLTFTLTAACGIGYAFTAWWLFNNGHVLPVLTPLLALFIAFLYHFSYSHIVESIEKSQMRNTFKKYVDPKLVEHLIESREADSDEIGRKKHIAVLFADVRGFTPMTEALRDTPEVIVEALNSYLELTASSIFGNGGSVDKFIGDATMGLFNGFVPLNDYVFKAVKAACDMVNGAQKVNEEIKKQTGVDLGFGIGVHCGEAIVGNLGPSFRKDYTAIGDAVNTAARLESNAAPSQVVVSREVYEIVKDRVTANRLGDIALKGKKEPMEVYEITGLK